MFVARKSSRGLLAGWIYEQDAFVGRGRAACIRRIHWIFGCKQIAVCSRSRCSGKNELVRRKAGPLVCLKHAVSKGVLLSQREIRLDIRRVHIHELRVRARTGWIRFGTKVFDSVRTVHLASVIHLSKRGMFVIEVVLVGKGDRTERNDFAFGVQSAGGDIGAIGDQYRILKEIVGGSVFLKDDDDVLNLTAGKCRTAASATVHSKQQNSSHNKQSGNAQTCNSPHGGIKMPQAGIWFS